ncbi:MAG TPA: hypothetical protein VGC88_10435 [Terriglobales bacterium]
MLTLKHFYKANKQRYDLQGELKGKSEEIDWAQGSMLQVEQVRMHDGRLELSGHRVVTGCQPGSAHPQLAKAADVLTVQMELPNNATEADAIAAQSSNINDFMHDFDQLEFTRTPSGDQWTAQNGTRFTAHVDSIGVSSVVHVDHPERSNLPETMLHETFHTLYFQASDVDLASAAGVPGAEHMTMEQASDAFSKEMSKHCNPRNSK